MSGGSFNYAYSRVETFVEALESKLRRMTAPQVQDSDEDADEDRVPEFSPETRARLAEIARLGEHYAKLMREAEWLFSGDSSEDSFHAELDQMSTSRLECGTVVSVE
jgi:hypothetical protein